MSVLQYLTRLVNQVGQAVALALQIVTTLISSGWYIVVRDAAIVTSDIHVLLDDPTCGQVAQCDKLTTLLSDTSDIIALLDAISTAVGGGRVVNLPSPPPTGYGGASSSDIASAVWDYTDVHGLFTAFGVLYNLYNLAAGLGTSWALPTNGPDYFRIAGDITDHVITVWPILDLPSPNTILPTDGSVGVWLTRTYPAVTWSFHSGPAQWVGTIAGPPVWSIYCTMSAEIFNWYRLANSGRIPGTQVAPVWPGLDNVTYGDTQSMDAPNGSLSGPADGYKIVIDATPSWAGKFDFGTVQAWRNVGAIAFVDDEGVPEPAQTLGLANVIYTPQRMAHSVGAYYRIATGYHASATPFVINS